MIELLLPYAISACGLMGQTPVPMTSCEDGAPPVVEVHDGVTLRAGDFTAPEPVEGSITYAEGDLTISPTPDEGFWRFGFYLACDVVDGSDVIASVGGHMEMFPGHYYDAVNADVVSDLDEPCYLPNERVAVVYGGHSDTDPNAEAVEPGWVGGDRMLEPFGPALALSYVAYQGSGIVDVHAQQTACVGSFPSNSAHNDCWAAAYGNRDSQVIAVAYNTSGSVVKSETVMGAIKARSYFGREDVPGVLVTEMEVTDLARIDFLYYEGGVNQGVIAQWLPQHAPGYEWGTEPGGYDVQAFVVRSSVLADVVFMPGTRELTPPNGVCDSWDCVVATCDGAILLDWFKCLFAFDGDIERVQDDFGEMIEGLNVVAYLDQSMAMMTGFVQSLSAKTGACGVLASFGNGSVLGGVELSSCDMTAAFGDFPARSFLAALIYLGAMMAIFRMLQKIVRGDGPGVLSASDDEKAGWK